MLSEKQVRVLNWMYNMIWVNFKARNDEHTPTDIAKLNNLIQRRFPDQAGDILGIFKERSAEEAEKDFSEETKRRIFIAEKLREIEAYDDTYYLKYLEERTHFDTQNIREQKQFLIQAVRELLAMKV